MGSGFAAVECAKKLEKEYGDNPEIEIVMIGEDNFLLFTPMLPQVASGMIETRHIVFPIRTICKKTKFYEGRIKNIDPYGFALENFDSTGRWRTQYRVKLPHQGTFQFRLKGYYKEANQVDASGEISNMKFVDVSSFKKILLSDQKKVAYNFR